MPRVLPSSLAVAVRRLFSTGAWVWLLEIDPGDGLFYRLCSGRRHQVYGGLKWQAAIAEVRLPREDSDGSGGDAEVIVPNASRVPGSAVLRGFVVGKAATLRLAAEGIDELPASLLWSYRVMSAQVTPAAVALRLGQPADIEPVPSRTYTKLDFPQLVAGGGVRP